mgnify:CR=1 FL=1
MMLNNIIREDNYSKAYSRFSLLSILNKSREFMSEQFHFNNLKINNKMGLLAGQF